MVVLLRDDAELMSWPLVGAGPGCPAQAAPDLSVVEHLARLQLVARRAGCSIRLRDASAALSELLDLAGLSDVVRDGAVSVVEMSREPEGGEEVGVEEGVERRDPGPRDLDHLDGPW
jgi:hypothetical protein